MEVSGQFPLIAVLGGGAIVADGTIVNQYMIQDEPDSDPFRELFLAQTQSMRSVTVRNKQLCWMTHDRDRELRNGAS